MKKIIKKKLRDLKSIRLDKLKVKQGKQEVKYDREIIGLVLSQTISVEWYLSEIIQEYFIDNVSKKYEFREYLLSKEFFGLEEKIRLLQKLNLNNKKEFEDILDEEDYKKIIKDLNYVQEIRNKLAHRLREPDKVNNCRKIVYLKDKKKKELLINKDFKKNFENIAEETIISLSEILSCIHQQKYEK